MSLLFKPASSPFKRSRRRILTDTTAEARALYGPSYPLINHFEVVTASRVSFLNDARHNYITAQLIVYPKQSSLAQWKLLAVGIERDSVSGALKSLWTELQSKMQIAIGKC